MFYIKFRISNIIEAVILDEPTIPIKWMERADTIWNLITMERVISPIYYEYVPLIHAMELEHVLATCDKVDLYNLELLWQKAEALQYSLYWLEVGGTKVDGVKSVSLPNQKLNTSKLPSPFITMGVSVKDAEKAFMPLANALKGKFDHD